MILCIWNEKIMNYILIIYYRQLAMGQQEVTAQNPEPYQILQIINNGSALLQHRQNGNYYLLRTFSTSVLDECQGFIRLLQKRQVISGYHLLQLVEVRQKKYENMCATIYKVYLLIEYPQNTLQKAIVQRKLQPNPSRFPQAQLWSIVYSCCIGCQLLCSVGLMHEALSASQIYIDESGLVKISDPLILGLNKNYVEILKQKQNCRIISPELIGLLQDCNFYFYDKQKSDIFILGLIMLQATLLKSIKLYDFKSKHNYLSIIPTLLQEVNLYYSYHYMMLLQDMLMEDPRKRPKFKDVIVKVQSQNHFGDQYTAQSSSFQGHINQFKIQDYNYNCRKSNHRKDSHGLKLSVNKKNVNSVAKPKVTFTYKNNPKAILMPSVISKSPQTINQLSKKSIQLCNEFNMLQVMSKQLIPWMPSSSTVKNDSSFSSSALQKKKDEQNDKNNLGVNNKQISVMQKGIFHEKFISDAKQTLNQHAQIGQYNYGSQQNKHINNNGNNYTTLLNTIYFSQPLQKQKKVQKSINILQSRHKESQKQQNQYKNKFKRKKLPQLILCLDQKDSQLPKVKTPSFNNNKIDITADNAKQQKLTRVQLLSNRSSSQQEDKQQTREQNKQIGQENTDRMFIKSHQLGLIKISSQYEEINQMQINSLQKIKVTNNLQHQSLQNATNITNQGVSYENSRKDSDNYSFSGLRVEGELVINSKQYRYVRQQQSGSVYQGYKLGDQKYGQGTIKFSDGSRYQGEWKYNKMHGYGKLYYNNGQIAYEGYWQMDLFHGCGRVFNLQPQLFQNQFDYKDFSILGNKWVYYEGEFQKDSKQGKGCIKLANGQVFQGRFDQDMIQGGGIFYTKNHTIVEGYWKENKLQSFK